MAASKSAARSLVLPGVAALIVFVILVSLGNWQLRRLAWKVALVEVANERPQQKPVLISAAADWPQFDVAASLYRPVMLRGRFLHDREAWVFTNLPDARGKYKGPGYWIVTPLRLAAGGTVWVNRGFAPDGRHHLADRKEIPDSETTTLIGLIRPDEPRTKFTPTDDPANNQFYARNIGDLSAAKELVGPLAPFTIDLVAKETPLSGLPQAGETRNRYPNNHLQYALTWYGLAGALAIVFMVFSWRRLHGKF